MIHPLDVPILGSGCERRANRRYSCPSLDDPKEVSAEMAAVLWGSTFASIKQRILPTETSRDIVKAMAELIDDNHTGINDIGNPYRTETSAPLSLIKAHMKSGTDQLICVCVEHSHRHHVAKTPEVLLLRRDDTYDLVLNFDRSVNLHQDVIQIVLEQDEQLFNLPGLTQSNFFIRPEKPKSTNELESSDGWWAYFQETSEKTAVVRLHVSRSARIGKWRMKLSISRLDGNQSPTDKRRNSAVAFQRLHVVANPKHIDRKSSFINFKRFSQRKLSKES